MHVSPAVDEGVDTHSHHMFTPNIALETSSHSRNNNIGRMMQCAAVYTSRRLSAMSGSSRKCMRLQGSKMVWWEFYTLPPHSYAEYWGRFTLGARAARHHTRPIERRKTGGRERWLHECRSDWHGGDHTSPADAATPLVNPQDP